MTRKQENEKSEGDRNMEYTKLGNSDLTVSRICMGCMGFGAAGAGQHSWTLDEASSREIIRLRSGLLTAPFRVFRASRST